MRRLERCSLMVRSLQTGRRRLLICGAGNTNSTPKAQTESLLNLQPRKTKMPKKPSEKCTEQQRKYLMQIVDSFHRRNPKTITSPMERVLLAKRKRIEEQLEPVQNKLSTLSEQKRKQSRELQDKMRKRANFLRKDIHFLSPEEANAAVQKFFDDFDPLFDSSDF